MSLVSISATHLVRSIFTSVTSPLLPKCSLSRASFRYLGMFLMHSLEAMSCEDSTARSSEPSMAMLELLKSGWIGLSVTWSMQSRQYE